MTPNKRADFIFNGNHCMTCLFGTNHLSKDFRQKSVIKCNASGCKKPKSRPTLLHGSTFDIKKYIEDNKKDDGYATACSSVESTTEFNRALKSSSKRSTLFKLVPVRATSGSTSIDTYAFIDSGSKAKLVVNDYSLDELQIASNPLIDETTRQSWTHLNGLNFPHVGVEDVKVLIGADQIAAQHYDEYRMPPPSVHAPWAFKTAFGSCMAGPTGPPTEGRGPVVCARITTERSIIKTWKPWLKSSGRPKKKKTNCRVRTCPKRIGEAKRF